VRSRRAPAEQGDGLTRRFLIVGLALRALAARAEEHEPDEPAATIVVTADRVVDAETRAPTAFVTVIDAAEHAEQLETVTDALAETVGVQVRRFGGLGAFSTVSIRGSSANQVQIYLDGIPLSRAREETVNLGDLPLDALERIEVYRGTAPVGFGVGGLAGVINLVTKSPSATPATEASASYGSFTTRKVSASHTRATHGIELLGHVTYLGSQGDFTFVDDRGTPLNPSDDSRVHRRNNSFDSVDALLKAGSSLGEGLRVDLTSELFFKDQGVAGIGSNQSRSASLAEFRSLNYLRLTPSSLLSDTLDLSGTVFGIFEREKFSDRRGELFGINQDTRNDTAVAGGNATGTYYPWSSQASGWFVEIAHEEFSPGNLVGDAPDDPNQRRLRVSAVLQHQASFFDGFVLVVPTLGYQHLEDHVAASFDVFDRPLGPSQSRSHDLWSPSLGTQLRLRSWLSLRGNLGYAERAPNFSELFGNRGFVRGEGSLDSESAINRDIGLVGRWRDLGWIDRLDAEYVYFNNDIDDLIVLVQFGQRVFRPVNVSGARVRGHELSLSGSLLQRLGLDFNYTRQDAEDRSDIPSNRGKRLPTRPRDEIYMRLQVFAEPARLYYEFNLISENFLDQVNFNPVPTRDTHTLGLVVDARDWLSLGFEARNITDNRLSDVAGFPLPGRAFFGSTRLRF
jgi:outer membrane cobalamin receptor